ncbi:hypothetical protein [Nocardioides soli]|uniref:Uncharacterized protein n=1 Tax=Nocardioides soli TaxID=1036020 RepID=A0A7W4VYH7_9ACTN|nr:hypothetical protein [Nocardioides soli]MBB3044109.1 hypothetical protein [Nocardioides soli]
MSALGGFPGAGYLDLLLETSARRRADLPADSEARAARDVIVPVLVRPVPAWFGR